jgi:hypothetical protein
MGWGLCKDEAKFMLQVFDDRPALSSEDAAVGATPMEAEDAW